MSGFGGSLKFENKNALTLQVKQMKAFHRGNTEITIAPSVDKG